MDTKEFKKIARETMDKHGLNDVGFSYMQSYHSFGMSGPNNRKQLSDKCIWMSRNFVEVNTLKECLDTLLHEMAHIFTNGEVSCAGGHGPLWAAKCVELGATPQPYWDQPGSKRNAVGPIPPRDYSGIWENPYFLNPWKLASFDSELHPEDHMNDKFSEDTHN